VVVPIPIPCQDPHSVAAMLYLEPSSVAAPPSPQPHLSPCQQAVCLCPPNLFGARAVQVALTHSPALTPNCRYSCHNCKQCKRSTKGGKSGG
jgi:hypothetical protein